MAITSEMRKHEHLLTAYRQCADLTRLGGSPMTGGEDVVAALCLGTMAKVLAFHVIG